MRWEQDYNCWALLPTTKLKLSSHKLKKKLLSSTIVKAESRKGNKDTPHQADFSDLTRDRVSSRLQNYRMITAQTAA